MFYKKNHNKLENYKNSFHISKVQNEINNLVDNNCDVDEIKIKYNNTKIVKNFRRHENLMNLLWVVTTL